jgi:hypothetical protein
MFEENENLLIAMPWLMRHLSERQAALEHLVDMMRFVVPHIFHLKMHVEMRKLWMPAGAVPLGWAKFLQPSGEMLAAFEECRQ